MRLFEIIRNKYKNKIIDWKQVNQKRVYFDIKNEDLAEFANYAFNELNLRYIVASGVDTPEGIEILYHFSEDSTGTIVTFRTIITDKNNPKIVSITNIIKGISWIEREIHELLGVDFVGHPNLKHLLLSEDWQKNNYPLRQDNGRK